MEEIKVTNLSCPQRLDQFVSERYQEFTRSHIKNMIDNGHILVNNIHSKAGYSLKLNDVISILDFEAIPTEIKGEDIDVDIIYQDKDLAIINKPQGMVVHPAIKNYNGTLVNALINKLDNLSSINGVIRPGIVHRIDKDTSGLMVVAKNDFAHVELSKQIATKKCRRIYVALIEGTLKQSQGKIETYIGRDKKNRLKMAVTDEKNGKYALTLYRVLEYYLGYTLVEFELKTGRTHQIRVHCNYIHHPIIGDKLYNPNKCKFALIGQLLHAKTLILEHPTTHKEMTFNCELPDYFKNVISKLKKEN